jgi:ABC-type Fe3+/spermidine/putrescine transport system ATPase subunit
VALARALATEPDVLLLDEPLSNLDAKVRQELRLELKALLRFVGTTSIVVTHDQEEAITLSEHVIIVNRGRIVSLSTWELTSIIGYDFQAASGS